MVRFSSPSEEFGMEKHMEKIEFVECMKNRLDTALIINASHCDHSGRLSIPACAELFLDAASLHAEQIDVGTRKMMEQNLFWIASRIKVELLERPEMMTEAVLSTWPMPPERVRCDREYSISAGSELIARGKTEWAVLNMKTKRIVPPASVFPEGICYTEPDIFPEPFRRFGRDFDGATVLGTHRIVSTDLDLGGHMNHVAYIRALFACFASKELDERSFHFLEAQYAAQSYEGETITFLSKEEDGTILTEALNEDGKIVFFAGLK